MAKLAINGGKPVSPQPIPLHRPSLGDRELDNVRQALNSGRIAGPGPFCEEVESRVEQELSVARTLTTTSCTHALEVALLALDLRPDDEVIVPSFTYVSTALSVLRAGARPVFADVDSDTLTLTPDTIKPALTERTRGVILVHYGGFPGPLRRVSAFCEQRGLTLIEDAAQCPLTRRNDKPAGTVGRFGAFSFHGTKSLSCGEGGLLVINEESDVYRCETIRDKGTDRSAGDRDKYTWRSTGSSYVLSDILGGILLAQIQRASSIFEQRRTIQTQLRDHLKSLDTRSRFRFIEPPETATENGHITGFLLRDPDPRDWFLEALQAEGVDARAHYRPLHQTPYAREHLDPPAELPVTERISKALVRLPTYAGMDQEEVQAIQRALTKVYESLPR